MKIFWKIIIVLILASSVVAVVLMKNPCSCGLCRTEIKNQTMPAATEEKTQEVNQSKSAEPNNVPHVTNTETASQKLPRLVDLGADKCIPCKMMKPVLEELNKEYKGKLQVEFYDVWKEPAFAQQYAIRVIPTQIFFGLDGKELYRHEGFFSKEDILAKWKEFGFVLSK